MLFINETIVVNIVFHFIPRDYKFKNTYTYKTKVPNRKSRLDKII